MNFWQLYFDLKSLTRDENFTPSKWSDNPPRYLRYQMLTSICTALSIELSEIEDGTFRTKLTDQQLYAKIKEIASLSKSKKFSRKLLVLLEDITRPSYGAKDLMFVYTKLLEMRLNIFTIQSHFSGVYSASGIYQLPILVNNEIYRKIKQELVWIDLLLMAFINPESRDLSKKQLIKNYHFPDVGLEEVDADYI